MAVYTLPDLPYDYGALELAMTGEVLELHRAGYEPLPIRLTIEQLYDHHGNAGAGSTTPLEFDACYLQCCNVQPDYGARLWDLVNRADVARRFREAKAGPAGRTAS